MLGLGLGGCLPAYSIHSYVQTPPDASCRKLDADLRESGWGQHQYFTLDETWIIRAAVMRDFPTRERYRPTDRPSVWKLELRCGSDEGGHQIPVRTCRGRGGTLGIVDPAQVRAVYPDLALGTRCAFRLSSRTAMGVWTHAHFSSVLMPSARSLLFEGKGEGEQP